MVRVPAPASEICFVRHGHHPEGSLPGTAGAETKTIIHPLIAGDMERFMAWRATDDYLAQWCRKEIQEHMGGKRVLLVAEVRGQLVGTVQFVPNHEEKDLADGQTTAYLEALEVKDGFRRRGLGTWLVTSVERLAVEQGFRRLTLMVEPDNDPALSLYRKRGFAFVKDFTEIWRGKPHPLQCMEKALAGCPNDSSPGSFRSSTVC